MLPMGGRCPPVRGGCPPVYERLQYMIIPVLVISFGTIAALSRLLRAQMLETISSDYIRTARAKGLPSRSVWIRHALRNAFIPFTVFLGPLLFGLIGGSVVIERVFSWPGVGLLLLDAAVSRDYPVVMASAVISSILAILAYCFPTFCSRSLIRACGCNNRGPGMNSGSARVNRATAKLKHQPHEELPPSQNMWRKRPAGYAGTAPRWLQCRLCWHLHWPPCSLRF